MYSKIYKNLCSGKYPIKSKYTEVHHIIPKYMGGNNDPSNLIELDVRQHKIAHWLLWKIYQNVQDKLVWYMRSGRYEEGIELRKEIQKEYFENRDKILTEEVSNSFEIIRNNLPKLKESNQFHSLKYKDKTSLRNYKFIPKNSLISKERRCRIKVYMFTKEGEYLQSFQSVYSAKEALNYSSIGNIHSAATGNRNYAAGFRWSFTKEPNELIPQKSRVYKKTGKQKNPSNHKNKIYKQIEQYDLKGNLLNVWNNKQEIQEHLGISVQMINHVINGRESKLAKTPGEYKGFIWKKGKQITIIEYN